MLKSSPMFNNVSILGCVSIPLKSNTNLIFLKQLNKIFLTCKNYTHTLHGNTHLIPYLPFDHQKLIAIHIYVDFNKFLTSTASETHTSCWWKKSGDHQLEVGSLAHYLRGFIHPRCLFGISEPSTVSSENRKITFQHCGFKIGTSKAWKMEPMRFSCG